jgi:hypothetical protein
MRCWTVSGSLRILTCGIVSTAGVQAFFFVALGHLSVAVTILLEMMGAPLLIVFWRWACTKQLPNLTTGIGVIVSRLGVLLVLDFRNASLNWTGILMAMAAAACFASYLLVSAIQRIRLPSIAFTGLGMGIGAIGTLIANLAHFMLARFIASHIDATVLMDGWRKQDLRRLPWLARNCQLDFKVTTDVQEPYDVFWKVRNVGVAEHRLRGEITRDAGRRTKRENTLYLGRQYVEAYIVKDGQVRAMDHHDVPIE